MLRDLLSDLLYTWHRWTSCGPHRSPSLHEVNEAWVWICPTCRSGWYADEAQDGRRIWVPIS